MYGLGQEETAVLETLPPRMRSIVMEELEDPAAREEMAELLRLRNPAKAIAREIAIAIDEEIRNPALLDDAGMEGLRKKFRRLRKKVSRVAKRVAKPVRKVVKRVARPVRRVVKRVARPVRRVVKRVGRPAVRFGKRYGALIVTAAGIVLAPFTGGASLAAAGLVQAGTQVHRMRKEAAAAKAAGKAEAAELAALAAQEEEKVNAQADAIYEESREHFLAIGLSPDRWAALSLDQKLGVIDAVSRGEVPAGYAIVPQAADAAAEAAQVHETPAQEPFPEEEPPPAPSPAVEGAFEVFVEGRLVGSVGTSQEAAELVARHSSPGDRVEIFEGQKSLGLKVRTEAGLVAVPPEEEAKVRAMPHGELRSAVARASARAQGAEARGGGIPWWLLLAVPVALFAA